MAKSATKTKMKFPEREKYKAKLAKKNRANLNLHLDLDTANWIKYQAYTRKLSYGKIIANLVKDVNNPSFMKSLSKINKSLLDKDQLADVELVKLQFLVNLCVHKFNLQASEEFIYETKEERD